MAVTRQLDRVPRLRHMRAIPLSARSAIAYATFVIVATLSCTTISDEVAPATSPTDAVVLATPDASARALEQPELDLPRGTIRLSSSPGLSPDPLVDIAPRVFSTSLHLIYEIHAGLMSITDDPNAPFAPYLAQSYETNSDFTAFTFQLRSGLKFSDGSPLTAADFKWTWERALKHGGTKVEFALGSIVGAQEILAGEAEELVGVNVIDDQVLEITTVEPDPHFLARVGNPVTFVLQPANAELLIPRYEHEKHYHLSQTPPVLPVGAGPFRVKGVRLNGTTELESNPHYHAGPPKVALVEMGGIDSYAEDIDLFESRAVDLFWLGRFSESFPAERIAPETNDGSIVHGAQSTRLDYLVFNDAKPPFDDPDFRKALMASVNHYETVAWPPSGTSTNQVAADPALAAQHLAASKYADSAYHDTAIYYTHIVGTFDWIFEEVAEAWDASVGLPTLMLYADETAYGERADAGDIDFALYEAIEEFPGIASVVEQVVGKLAEIADGPAAKRVVAMTADARTTVDPVERQRKYYAVSDELIEHALVIPLDWWVNENAYFVRNNVSGFTDPKYGGSRLAGVRVEW